MFRTLYSLLLSLAAMVFLMVAPVAAEPQFSRAPAEFVPVSHQNNYDRWDGRWNERICCQRNERRGYRVFWSTRGECQNSGGQSATNKTCRKYGGFHPYQGRGNGWNQGNGQYDGWSQGHDQNGGWNQGYDQNERVCCVRNGEAWWSNRGECARNWGQPTANKVCRR